MELIKKDIFVYIVLSILFAITVQQFPFFKGNSLHLIHAIKNFEFNKSAFKIPSFIIALTLPSAR